MRCDDIGPLMMAYLDGELDAGGQQTVDRHITQCAACSSEWQAMAKLKGVTDMLKFAASPDDVWDAFQNHPYNRQERRTGWALASAGTVILLLYGLWFLLNHALGFFYDPEIPLFVRIGVGLLSAGAVTLFVSIVRERWTMWKTERYKEIIR